MARAQGEAQLRNTPSFLVATPDLNDPVFGKTVILMVPTTQPPLIAGIIVNKPTTYPVQALFPHAAVLARPANTVYFGGPVNIAVSLVMKGAPPSVDAAHVFADTYVSSDDNSIAAVLKDRGQVKDLRLMVGRAQWTGPQLNSEIMRGSWYIVPAREDMVFSIHPGQVWRLLVQRAQLQEVNAGEAPGPQPFVPLLTSLCARGVCPARFLAP